uniref:FBA_2 domain-containing protein n=1 Tax=Steinernema glaseri TaxID=37863 RepID=A0A1I7Y421_9BILA
MNDVLRLLPVSNYDAFCSLQGRFGQIAKQWKERWFVAYLLIYMDPTTKKIEWALVKEQNIPKFLPNSYADLTECALKDYSHFYEKEFTVSINESKTYEELHMLTWTPTTVDQIRTCIRNVKCDMKCLAVSVIPPWERGDLPPYNPDFLLSIIPRETIFNDITIDDDVRSSYVDERLQQSIRTGKLRHVTYEKFIEEAPVEYLMDIAVSTNVECVEVSQRCEHKPFLKELTELWMREPEKFTRQKTICGLCKLAEYHTFAEQFRRFDRLPGKEILDETVSSEYVESDQVFFEMKHPTAPNRRIVIGFFGNENWEVKDFKDCTEDRGCLSYCLFMID